MHFAYTADVRALLLSHVDVMNTSCIYTLIHMAGHDGTLHMPKSAAKTCVDLDELHDKFADLPFINPKRARVRARNFLRDKKKESQGTIQGWTDELTKAVSSLPVLESHSF